MGLETQMSGGCWSRVGGAEEWGGTQGAQCGKGGSGGWTWADLSGGMGGLPWQSAPPEKRGSRQPPGSWGPASRRAGNPTPQRPGATAVGGRPRAVCASAGTSAARRAPACLRISASAGSMGAPTR